MFRVEGRYLDVREGAASPSHLHTPRRSGGAGAGGGARPEDHGGGYRYEDGGGYTDGDAGDGAYDERGAYEYDDRGGAAAAYDYDDGRRQADEPVVYYGDDGYA